MEDTVVRTVQVFYEARASLFDEPYLSLGPYSWGGVNGEVRGLPRPDEYVAAPPAALEACGFYFVNVLLRDNGSVSIFQADADGQPTFGVYATTDGDESHLEIYDPNGAYVCGAVIRGGSSFDWREKEAVRYHAGIEGRE